MDRIGWHRQDYKAHAIRKGIIDAYGKAFPSKNLKSWYERIPKVELHLHLEGAIPYEVLWELIRKYGGNPHVPDQAALLRKFEYKDFPHFIETWIWKNQYLREYEDFTFIAEAVARDLASQNIRYAEAFLFSTGFHASRPEYARLDAGHPGWPCACSGHRGCADR